jgi:hypothetical protein
MPAIQLIAEAEYVADIVDQVLSEIPDQFEADRNRLRSEAAALKQAIHETHNLHSFRGAAHRTLLNPAR